MPSDWVISDVLFSETNTVAGLYSPFLHVCHAKEMMSRYAAYHFSQNKIKLFYSDLSAFSLIYGLGHYNTSKLILQ